MISPRLRLLPPIPVVACFLALAAAPVAAGPALVAIDAPSPDLTPRLLAEDVTVVRDRASGLLALVDPGESRILDRMGLRWREIDPDVTGRTYYVVGIPDLSRLADVREEVPILDATTHEAVIAADRSLVERIAGRGLELEWVPLRAVVPPRVTPSAPRLGGEALPLVEEMVARVVADSVTAHVAYFQGLQTRLAYTSNAWEAAQYIEDAFASYGLDTFRHDFDSNFSPNVVGVLPGSAEPGRAILIGGHYDSIAYVGTMGAPGADDNASGTAAVIECARALSGYQFERTLLFVGFGAEELGLVGSAALAADIDDLGYELDAMLNVDMCGHVEPGDFADIDVIANPASEWLREHVLAAGNLYAPAMPTIASPPPGAGTSDHASFWSRGYPAIFFFEDSDRSSRYIHTDQDVIGLSYNSPELAAHTTRVATASMATLAGPLGLTLLHSPVTDTDDPEAPVRLTATIVSPEPLDLDSLFVHYVVEPGMARGAGEELRAPLVPTGEGNVYEAFVPAQSRGSFVRYYLSAEDVLDRRVTHPADAPASWHRYYVGTALTIASDEFELDQGWTTRAAGDDATAGLWERVDPVGTIAEGEVVQSEDDHTPDPGSICWVTGNGSPGGPAGSTDVDGGRTTLLSPFYDLTGYDDVGLAYHRWYVNGDGDDTWQVDVNDGSGWVPLEVRATTDRTWRRVEIPLRAHIALTDAVQFRFVAEDQGAPSLVEAGLDDVTLTGYLEDATPIDPGQDPGGPLVPGRLAQRVRNPFTATGTVELMIPAPARRVTLRVVDVAGREVARLLDGVPLAGHHRLDWDGRSAGGDRLPSGLYLVHLDADGERRTAKLIMVR